MKNLLKCSLCILLVGFMSCNNAKVEKNKSMYSEVWDEIINSGNLDQINETNFTDDITLVMSPENIVGIDGFKDYYSNFVTGFSDVEFTIVDLFGQDDKLVKHWSFKGTHSGDFFGIPATGKSVDLEGTTLVVMKDGKIAQEQDFMDNVVFMSQLGIDPFLNPNNVMVVQKLYNDFAKGDIAGIQAAMDEKVVWNEAENFPLADRNPYIGFDAIAEGVFGRIQSDWEYWNLTDLDLQEMTNDKVLTTGRYQAKYKKNGAIINLQMAHLWTLKDGKVISFQQFADTKGITDAMNK